MDLNTALKEFANAIVDRGPEERLSMTIDQLALAIVAAAAVMAPIDPPVTP
jgi:hypothetical protein